MANSLALAQLQTSISKLLLHLPPEAYLHINGQPILAHKCPLLWQHSPCIEHKKFIRNISMPVAKFYCIDIKDFYLNSQMPRSKYMHLRMDIVPNKIKSHYKLDTLAHNGVIYI